MVRSFRTTLNLFQWLPFLFIILVSIFAVYIVEAAPPFGFRDETEQHNILIEQQAADPTRRNDLVSTALVLISMLDGSIVGVDRFKGHVYWTLQGGPALIKANSHHATPQPEETEEQNIFRDVLPDIDSFGLDEFDMDHQNAYQEPWDDQQEPDIYYIIEPQDGGSIYVYGDGRPLQVK